MSKSIHFWTSVFWLYENKVLQLMSAGASLKRFGEKYLVFKKCKSCKHCFKNEWTLELHPKPTNNAIIIKGVYEKISFAFDWIQRPTKFPSKSFISKAKFILILYFLRFKLKKMCRLITKSFKVLSCQFLTMCNIHCEFCSLLR